jgi:thioredoxin-like negative regulator of GroEL
MTAMKRQCVGRVRFLTAAMVLTASAGLAGERPALGSRAPLPPARDLRGAQRSVGEFAGPRGLVLLFWAGWSERSIQQLQRFDKVAAEMKAHGVGLVAVNVERHDAGEREVAGVRDRIGRLKVNVPVLIDDGLEIFNAYGVVAVPSTALIDGGGKLTYFTYGYAHGQSEDLFDALDRLAGIERTRPTDRQKAAPAAIRRLQFGRMQLSQGRVEPARRSFEAAVEADASFADPLVELAALALDDRDVPGARALLDRAATLEKGSIAVRRERARLQIIEQGRAAGIGALKEIASTNQDPIAAAYLRFVEGTGDVDAAARAMTAYRREVAAGRP